MALPIWNRGEYWKNSPVRACIMFPTVILLIFCSFLQSAGKSKMPVFLLVYDLKENTHVLKQSVWLHHNITTREVQVLLSFPTTIRINFIHFLLPHCILKHNCIFKKYMTEIELFVLDFFKKCSYWFVGSFPKTGSLDTGNVYFNGLMFCFQAECLHLSDVCDAML